jgi:hypothetical protein
MEVSGNLEQVVGLFLRAEAAACKPEHQREQPPSRVDSRSNKCNVMMLKLTRYEFWDGREAERFAVR